jgi:hypothetical protein
MEVLLERAPTSLAVYFGLVDCLAQAGTVASIIS